MSKTQKKYEIGSEEQNWINYQKFELKSGLSCYIFTDESTWISDNVNVFPFSFEDGCFVIAIFNYYHGKQYKNICIFHQKSLYLLPYENSDDPLDFPNQVMLKSFPQMYHDSIDEINKLKCPKLYDSDVKGLLCSEEDTLSDLSDPFMGKEENDELLDFYKSDWYDIWKGKDIFSTDKVPKS